MIGAYQVGIPSGSAVTLAAVGPGIQVALSVPGGTVYVGSGTALTTATGAPVSGYALLPGNPVSGSLTTLYAISAAGTVACGVVTAGPR